jgi:predicted nuclease of predicted toxin-antitoxin system
MKFLLDVNASGTLSNLLMELGHDIAWVNRVNSKMSDDEILTWAVSEQRIIITTDSDFEQMIWLQGRTHCGIVRLENLPRAQRIALFQDILNNYAEALELGYVIIATSQKIRVRRQFKDMSVEN